MDSITAFWEERIQRETRIKTKKNALLIIVYCEIFRIVEIITN